MTPAPEPVLRDRGGDRHPLFLNHGTWFVRYRLLPSPRFKADRRFAVSLGTKDLAHLHLAQVLGSAQPQLAA